MPELVQRPWAARLEKLREDGSRINSLIINLATGRQLHNSSDNLRSLLGRKTVLPFSEVAKRVLRMRLRGGIHVAFAENILYVRHCNTEIHNPTSCCCTAMQEWEYCFVISAPVAQGLMAFKSGALIWGRTLQKRLGLAVASLRQGLRHYAGRRKRRALLWFSHQTLLAALQYLMVPAFGASSASPRSSMHNVSIYFPPLWGGCRCRTLHLAARDRGDIPT